MRVWTNNAVSDSRQTSSTAPPAPPLIRNLGLVGYTETWQAMRSFTHGRDADTRDEIWLVQHPPVFTLGQIGKLEHLLAPGDIPVVNSDRGGQATYHGPGQLIAYILVDLGRLRYGIRSLVTRLENTMIGTLAHYGIAAAARPEAPGVYVGQRKIGALGLRVRHSRSYHGLALNVAMDLEPFSRINPCGYPGLEVTQLSDLGVKAGITEVTEVLLPVLLDELFDLASLKPPASNSV